MTYQFGKAIDGGTPLTQEELDKLAADQIAALKQSLVPFKRPEKSDDVLDQRLSEELRLAQRILEMLESEARRRGDTEAANALDKAEDAIEDVADIIEADDRCEAIETVDDDMARRLTRKSIDGEPGPCHNRFSPDRSD